MACCLRVLLKGQEGRSLHLIHLSGSQATIREGHAAQDSRIGDMLLNVFYGDDEDVGLSHVGMGSYDRHSFFGRRLYLQGNPRV